MTTVEHCTEIQMLSITYKPPKKQEPFYWFLDSSFGFPTTKKLQVAVSASLTWCWSCRLFLINFSFLQEKSIFCEHSVAVQGCFIHFSTPDMYLSLSFQFHCIACYATCTHQPQQQTDFHQKLVTSHTPCIALGLSGLIHLSLAVKSSI